MSLSSVGPGASALKSCRPATPSLGRMAMKSTIIPMPPSHELKDRQKRRLLERASISTRIEDPVEVKPDIVSKTASIKEIPSKRKGIAPKIAAESHVRATIARASFCCHSTLLLMRVRSKPARRVMRIETIKGFSGS